ncbi:hypothetical protein [Reyranella sp.]|uniref:hypothetical protein n=1 Tax=Reyranella sp. TaxID=1929291 RepID=UPI003D0AF760
MANHPFKDVFQGTAAADDISAVIERNTPFVAHSLEDIRTRDLARTWVIELRLGTVVRRYVRDDTSTAADDGVNVIWDDEDRAFVLLSAESAGATFVRARVAATGNVAIATALEAGDTLDGVTLAENDVVLLPAQSTAHECGIYVVPASGAASRHASFATYDSMPGVHVSVMEGTVNADTLWRCTSNKGGTLGSTALVFAEFESLGAVPIVADRTALAGRSAGLAYLVETGREGLFRFDDSDLSAAVSADALKGLYVAPASDATGESGAWVRVRNNGDVRAKWFGAAGNGVTDDEAAINAAIQHLPATGGTCWLDGKHLVEDTIRLGNGTSSTLSTRHGVILRGAVPPVFARDGSALALTPAASIIWGGGTGQAIVDVAGPMIGGGVCDLLIDGDDTTGSVGLRLKSISRFEHSRLTIRNCAIGLQHDCHDGTGFDPVISGNTEHVRGSDIIIEMPAMADAIGYLATGPASGAASSAFITMDTLRIYPQSTNRALPIIFQVADGIKISNLLIFHAATAHADSYNIIFDYSLNGTFPSGIMLDMIDVGWNIPAGRQIVNSGSPGSLSTPNHVTNISEINGGRYPSNISNTLVDLPKKCADLLLSGTDAGVSSTTMFVPKIGTRYRISWHIAVTTAGSGGNILLTFSYKDDAGIARNKTVETLACNSTDSAGNGSLLIESSLSSPYINYQVDFSGVSGSPEYTLAATVERLN